MDPGKPLPMTPFDSLTSSGELQMLKLLLPYTPPSVQRMLAFFIRFTELQRAVRYFSVFRDFREGADPEGAFASTPPAASEILQDLRPYLGGQADTVDMILSAMSMMEMMQDMAPPGAGDPGSASRQASGGPDMTEILQMMHMFQGGGFPDDSGFGSSFGSGGPDKEPMGKEWCKDGAGMDEPPGNEGHGSGEGGADPDRGGADGRQERERPGGGHDDADHLRRTQGDPLHPPGDVPHPGDLKGGPLR